MSKVSLERQIESENATSSEEEDLSMETLRKEAELLRLSHAQKSEYTKQQVREYDYAYMTAELAKEWEDEATRLKLTDEEIKHRKQLLKAVLKSDEYLNTEELSRIHEDLTRWLERQPTDKGVVGLAEVIASQQKLVIIRLSGE